MLKNKTAVIICSYGLYDAEIRTKIEMEGYDEYLFQCKDFILKNRNVDTVILTGGFTNSRKSNISEAQSVFVHMRKLLPKINILIEEQSVNSPQNVWEGLKRVGEDMDVIVICDDWRFRKMQAICRYIGRKKKKKIEVKSFSRKDIHPNSSYLKQGMQALVFYFFPGLIEKQICL